MQRRLSCVYEALVIAQLFELLLARCFSSVSAVWADRVFKQYAAEVADVAFGVRSGGRPGHQS